MTGPRDGSGATVGSSAGADSRRERPILFSAPMVRAILEGRKTQTRRIVRVVPKRDGFFASGRPIIPEKYGAREGVLGYNPRPDGKLKGRAKFVAYLLDGMGLAWRPYGGSPDVPWPAERIGEVSPYGAPGDRLWCRETWAETQSDGGPVIAYASGGYLMHGGSGERRNGTWRDEVFPGNAGEVYPPERWRPSIFMPRWASRISLEVTNVRVQRLQEISEEDANAEGCMLSAEDQNWSQCRRWYEGLWDQINGKRAPWSSNPWVWAVSFRRCP